MVVPPSTPVMIGMGVNLLGNNETSPLGEGVGVYSYLIKPEISEIVFISLSCSAKYDPVSNCNHDTGDLPFEDPPLRYCLRVQNPYSNVQKVGVIFSDTTVFGIDFTSPGNGDGQTGATIAMP